MKKIPSSNLTKKIKKQINCLKQRSVPISCILCIYSFFKTKKMEDFDFFALILLEHAKVSSLITKMK